MTVKGVENLHMNSAMSTLLRVIYIYLLYLDNGNSCVSLHIQIRKFKFYRKIVSFSYIYIYISKTLCISLPCAIRTAGILILILKILFMEKLHSRQNLCMCICVSFLQRFFFTFYFFIILFFQLFTLLVHALLFLIAMIFFFVLSFFSPKKQKPCTNHNFPSFSFVKLKDTNCIL